MSEFDDMPHDEREAAGRSWADSVRAAVRQFEAPLLLYALRLLKNQEEAQDVVQEAFLRLCAEDRTAIEGHLSVWLFSVCRNLCMDVRRKRARAAAAGEDLARRSPDVAPTPDQLFDQDQSVAQALSAMETFSPKQQEVLRLKFQHSLSYREIAEIMHLSVTNVGFLIHTGLKKIREQLAQLQDK